MKRIGGLWVKKSKKDGTSYLSGSLDLVSSELRVVLMKNKEKKSDRSPDWIVYKSEPMKEQPNSKSVSVVKEEEVI